jgi:adenylylsulfate kinase-like enzyme
MQYGGVWWEDRPMSLFVISGIPAAGKTTVARLLSRRMKKAVCVPGDTIRSMVVTGLAPMNPNAGETELHHLLLRYRSALAIAAIYLEAGFDAVVEDVIIGPVLGEFLALVPVKELHLVFLNPDAETLRERDRKRTKTAYSEERWDVHELRGVLRAHTRRLGLWLDTSRLTPDQTVDEILADLDASLVRPDQW